jgi:hypothetical protein
MKKIFISLAFVASILGVPLIAPDLVSAAGSTPPPTTSPKCGGSDPDFLSFPTWYRGLDCTSSDSIDIETGSEVASIVFTIALNIIDIILRIIGIVAVGFVIWGGFQYIISRGEPERAKSGLVTIRNALVGMVIAMVAAMVVSFIVSRLSA